MQIATSLAIFVCRILPKSLILTKRLLSRLIPLNSLMKYCIYFIAITFLCPLKDCRISSIASIFEAFCSKCSNSHSPPPSISLSILVVLYRSSFLFLTYKTTIMEIAANVTTPKAIQKNHQLKFLILIILHGGKWVPEAPPQRLFPVTAE
ncbi:hypothetical protein HanPI659440_Chr11g0440311 [Helianthus annuus]|nr:hypothetical protein HanPI659440_Chr11g0440311 [Helianthus annuus]